MKRTALSLLFMLLSAAFCLGRTGSDQDTTHAIKGVHRLQESLGNPDNLQIPRAVVTKKGVCMEYRSRNGFGRASTGFAVYRIDKDLVYIDNSWVWDQVCLVGKYGQRRDGEDVTEAVAAALGQEQAPAPKSQQPSSAPRLAVAAAATASAIQLVTPASRVEALAPKAPSPAVVHVFVAPVQAADAVPQAGTVRNHAVAAQESVAVVASPPVAMVPAARVEILAPIAKPPTASLPVVPLQAAQASAVVVAPVGIATQPASQTITMAVPVAIPGPSPQSAVAVVAPASGGSAPSTAAYAISSAPIAAVALGTIRGVTIVDNNGALERKGPPPAPESLGDAARRLRQSKQR